MFTLSSVLLKNTYRFFLSFVASLTVLLLTGSALAAVNITDDNGHTLTLDAPVQRVVVLHSAFSDMLLALGKEKTLVGRESANDGIRELREVPVVSVGSRLDPQSIAALRPEVVLQLMGRSQGEAFSHGLRQMGLTVLLFRMDNFEAMFSVFQRMGVLTGAKAEAAQVEAHYRKRLRDVQHALLNEPRRRVFCELRYPHLLGAGRANLINDIILHAGGRNVISTDDPVVRVPEEELFRHNPDVYLIQTSPANPSPTPLSSRKNFDKLDALRQGRVYMVDEQDFARLGPRSIHAVERLARWMYPDADFQPVRH